MGRGANLKPRAGDTHSLTDRVWLPCTYQQPLKQRMVATTSYRYVNCTSGRAKALWACLLRCPLPPFKRCFDTYKASARRPRVPVSINVG